jgi:transcriptional regulator of acetoin/glycerol metabolism
VRELQAVIERAAILGDGRRLEVAASLGVMPDVPASKLQGTSLAEVNRDAMVEALRRTRGQIEGAGGAAEVLGIKPGTLRSRMRKLGLRWESYRDV